jgi:hypothetical protein
VTERLFAVDGPTPTERSARSAEAAAAQLDLFGPAPAATAAYCHACAGGHDVAACPTASAGNLFES